MFDDRPLAATIGRIIGVNPYWHDGLNPLRKQEEICKHCVYGMGGDSTRNRRRRQAKFIQDADSAISEIYQEGLKRHRSEPMEFQRYHGERPG